ncbi:unnamed protein product [Parascedosporium putredinis]|uniref:Major facilitator superfamily (MFS) profile domain-containing protein n=1 Tax=Parascedosporium putredinis TaxID=1442378 RepID=A0A9P1GWH6_9PEZI|nr:unnamed protein product [Parascedosporium putredinis]CAI7988343.1 unnamed protein product [Parascedosporium putredinis]
MGKGYTWRCAAIAGSGSMLYGYDTAVIAGTFAQEGFLGYFKPSSTILGAIGSVYFGGLMLGLIFVSLLADRFGRRRTIQIGGVIGLVGAILQTVATHIGPFFAGRAVAGLASGIMLTTVNVYQAEIAPPSLRGTMVAFQIVTLMDRHEEAKATLMRLNDDNEDPSFWEKEYLQISAQIALEKREMEGSSWTHMFTNMKEFRRVAVAAASVISVQTNGAQTIQVFQAVLYTGLGFSTRGTLLMAGVFGICNTLGGLTNLFLIDRVGRRILFLAGLATLSVWLGVFAACTAQYNKTGLASWGKAGVGFVMVYIYTFGTTYAASPYAYSAEVLPTKNRASGMAFGLFFANALTLTFSQVAPIALEKIEWKFNLVFIACNIFFFFIAYFFFPETKGLTLEEVNRLFGDKVAVEIRDVDITEKEGAHADHGYDRLSRIIKPDNRQNQREDAKYDTYNRPRIHPPWLGLPSLGDGELEFVGMSGGVVVEVDCVVLEPPSVAPLVVDLVD